MDQSETNSPTLESVKMSELRAKEARLGKWEKELKIKESKLEEVVKGKLKLETYTKKIENKVNELEKTILTLRNRIVTLEGNDSGNCRSESNEDIRVDSQAPGAMHPEFSTNFHKLHNRISNIVFSQIDKQLDNIEQSLNKNNEQKSDSSTSNDRDQPADSSQFEGNPIFFQTRPRPEQQPPRSAYQSRQPNTRVQSALASQQLQTQSGSLQQGGQQASDAATSRSSLPLPNLQQPPPPYVPPQLLHPQGAGLGDVPQPQQYGPQPPPIQPRQTGNVAVEQRLGPPPFRCPSLQPRQL